jgi:hypothetical protein
MAIFRMLLLSLSMAAFSAAADVAPPSAADAGSVPHYEKFLKNGSLAGMDRLECDTTIALAGDRIYVGAHYGGGVNILRNDPTGLSPTYLGFIDLTAVTKPKQHMDCNMAVGRSGILYVVSVATHAGGNNAGLGLFWYKVAADGSSQLLGRQRCDAGTPTLSADGKSLYLQANFTGAVYRYALADDGTPAQAEKVAGAGLFGKGPLSSDGRWLYSLSLKDHSIGRVGAKDDGTLAYGGALDFSQWIKPVGEVRNSMMAISPDGRHAYAALWGYGVRENGKFKNYNALAVFNRDIHSGELTFAEMNPAEPRMANMETLLFRPDGKTAYYVSGNESSGDCVGWLTCDPETGRLTFGGAVPEASNGTTLAWSSATGTLYAPTWKIGNSGVHILRTAAATKAN